MDHLASQLVVAAQYWPACSVCLGQGHLQLGAQNPELALFWLYACEQREDGIVAFAIRCSKVEVDVVGLEVDNGVGLVDLLEV